MKWKTHTKRYPRGVFNLHPVIDGGYRDPEMTYALRMHPDLFRVIRPRLRVYEFGRAPRRPRPQPRTMPWIVAIPLLIWLWWNGEL